MTWPAGDFTSLTPQPFQNVLISQWSPNGDWIAFTATPIGDELGTQILYTVRPDGSGLATLTSPDEYVLPLCVDSSAVERGGDKDPRALPRISQKLLRTGQRSLGSRLSKPSPKWV